jgi:hypothetical protein
MRFLNESLAQSFLAEQFFPQYMHQHLALKPLIVGAIYYRQAPGAQLLLDPVTTVQEWY